MPCLGALGRRSGALAPAWACTSLGTCLESARRRSAEPGAAREAAPAERGDPGEVRVRAARGKGKKVLDRDGLLLQTSPLARRAG